MPNKPKPAAKPQVGDRLEYHYQKSPEYRTIHVDGAHGGITPRGYITFTLYNERSTIPRRGSREVIEAGEHETFLLGPENIEETLSGVMRQLEVTVFMDMNTSREFLKWLREKVGDLEDHLGILEKDKVVKKHEAK